VTDDVLDLKGRYKKRKDVWFMRDSLQVYFDTWAGARFRQERGYDNNDYRRQGLTLTPAGTGPYMNPHLWPLWVLGK